MKTILLSLALAGVAVPCRAVGMGLGSSAAKRTSAVVAKTVAKSTTTAPGSIPPQSQGGGNSVPLVPVPGVFVKWAYVGEPVLYSSPALGPDGTVYFGTAHHFQYYSTYWRQGQTPPPKPYGLYAYKADGTLKWKYSAGSDAPARGGATLAPDGTVYMVFERLHSSQYATTAELHAVKPDGTAKWSVTISTWYSEIGNLTPTLGADGTVYVAGANTIAFNPDGTEKWRHWGGFGGTNLFYASPAIGHDGTIYTVVWVDHQPYGQAIHAIAPDGTLLWEGGNLGTYPISCSPSIAADGTIYIGIHDTEGLSGSHNGALVAYSSTGTIKWAFPVGDFDVRSSPSIDSDGTIYFGTKGYDGFVYALKPDGTQKWRYPTSQDNNCPGCGTDVYNTPAIGADGTIYAFSEFNFLYAFNPDGSVKWKDNALLPSAGGGGESSATIAPDGTLYIGKTYGGFVAVQTGSFGLSSAAQWAKFHRDAAESARRP